MLLVCHKHMLQQKMEHTCFNELALKYVCSILCCVKVDRREENSSPINLILDVCLLIILLTGG